MRQYKVGDRVLVKLSSGRVCRGGAQSHHWNRTWRAPTGFIWRRNGSDISVADYRRYWLTGNNRHRQCPKLDIFAASVMKFCRRERKTTHKHTVVISVSCPTCGVAAGMRCKLYSGAPRIPHV